MARQRRGGLRTPEVKGTLGTLLRTTLQQASAVREVVGEMLDRGAREGRARLDEFRSERRGSHRRQDALADLGELVLDLIRRGEIDLDELPEARELVDDIEAIDADGADDGTPPRDVERDVTRAQSRRRFDDRGRDDDRRAASRTSGHGADQPADREDGTVSSGRWAPPKGATPSREAAAPRVWRPPVAEAPTVTPPTRKGGIRFEVEPDPDDADLADYMHPDDVPPKPEPGT